MFLSPHEVGDCFVEDFMPDRPVDNRIIQFSDYLVENYIDDDSLFPPCIWAEKTASLLRTTNTCESFHSKFNRYCSSTHPNVHLFLNSLKSMQVDSYIKINSANQNINRKIRKAVTEKEHFIKKKIELLETNEINRYDYVKCVSYKFSNILL